MEIGEEIIIGRLGQQPMHIADPSVDPQHATLRRTGEDTYQIEDRDSQKGVQVFGFRVKRKTIKAETPLFLGSYKTSVRQLLQDAASIDLTEVWNRYEKEKRRWDRYTLWVNSIRMLSPVLTMLVTQWVGQNWVVSGAVLIGVMVISMIAGEKVLAKKYLRMAELNTKMQAEYACPHCHRFIGFTPYSILKQNRYCPHCGVPLP